MKKTFCKKKSAFSLIELSIVLIIIGLLIAGITGGASLIRSAELRAVIGEYRGYSTAVNGFYVQYNDLPGDYSRSVGGSYQAANSNQVVEYILAGGVENDSGTPTTIDSPAMLAWNQLIVTGGVDNTLPALNANFNSQAVTVAQTVGTNFPSAKIRNAGWHFDYRFSVGTDAAYSTTSGVNEGASAVPAFQNVLVLTGAIDAGVVAATSPTLVNGGTNLASASLTGPDALSIDERIDDGFANSGRIRGLNPKATTGCYAALDSANAEYITASSSARTCAMTFRIDPNS